MDSRERVTVALKLKEPDRVPIFEIAVSSKIAEYFLGKKKYIWGTGETTKALIEAEMRSEDEYRSFIYDGYSNMLEVYYKAGLDMMLATPTAFVTPLNFGLHNVGVADIYEIEIVKENENLYKLISTDPAAEGFWGKCVYSPKSGTFQMVTDNVKEGGEKEFERYVEYLEKKDC